jgi:hypothetical protein
MPEQLTQTPKRLASESLTDYTLRFLAMTMPLVSAHSTILQTAYYEGVNQMSSAIQNRIHVE